MNGNEIEPLVWQFLRENWSKIVFSVICLTLGAAWGRWRSYRQWRRREFVGRLNISLNSIVDGKLIMRTLREDSLEEIFLNTEAVRMILAAAKKSTIDTPVLEFPKNDAWFLLNSVLNVVSEQFSIGLVKRDLGQPVLSAKYVICLTFECDGEVRTRKIRAMVLREELLENLPAESPGFEKPHHKIRFKTLQTMAALRKTRPELFISVDVAI